MLYSLGTPEAAITACKCKSHAELFKYYFFFLTFSNPNVPTIEGTVFKALCQAGAVSKDNSDDVAKVQLCRAARTDKGVHAVGQVISLKMLMIPEIIHRVQSFLPDQIRLYGFVRTKNKFQARVSCCSRKYEYLLPTYLLERLPDAERVLFSQDLPESYVQDLLGRSDPDKEQNGPATGEKKEEDEEKADLESAAIELSAEELAVQLAKAREFRLSSEDLERTRQLFKLYEGSHNFHNYTVGRPHWDDSCRRVITSFACSDPFMIGDTEWLSIKVHGQSFMLHQIRKMVGMVIMMAQTGASPSIIEESYKCVRLHTPKAPAEGLMLLHPVYDAYNKQIESLAEKNGACLDRLDFDAFTTQMQLLKEDWIYKDILAKEEKGVFLEWGLQARSRYMTYAYLREDGVIPQAFYELAHRGINDPSRREESRKRQKKVHRKAALFDRGDSRQQKSVGNENE